VKYLSIREKFSAFGNKPDTKIIPFMDMKLVVRLHPLVMDGRKLQTA
jgi:hypothetical protein